MFVLHRLSLFSGVLFAEFEAVKESAFLLMIVLLLSSFLFLRSVARKKKKNLDINAAAWQSIMSCFFF